MVNGIRPQANNFLLDGIDNNESLVNTIVFFTAPDAIQEFRVETNVAPAEFGRAGGGIINSAIKSGTNQWHGVLWEFFRNSALDATPWVSQHNAPKPLFYQNQFGAAGGGPLIELGVTTLWLTPVYDNDNSTSDYHGYGAIDLCKVEDHFGTMAEYQNLVAAAHKKGLKILFDTVPNHVGPNHPWAKSPPAPGWLHGTPEHHINTDYDYPPITDPHAVERNRISALNGWFANLLPDLAQENPRVAQYLLQNALWWTEISGIDGLRIDTFPYVPRTFWHYYLSEIFLTYPNLFTLGEIYNFRSNHNVLLGGRQRRLRWRGYPANHSFRLPHAARDR